MPQNLIGRALRNRRAGHDALAWARPDLQAPESFSLTSPAFAQGASIPERYKGRLFSTNISPALAWTQPPPETAELALIVQDPDAPMRTPAMHALAVGIDPTRASLPEGALAYPSPIEGIKHGKGLPGHRGWAGPMPPRSHGPHTYAFQLFAVDCHPELPDKFDLDDLLKTLTGHVVARARLDGIYENT